MLKKKQKGRDGEGVWSWLFLRNPTDLVSPSPHLKMETDPVSDTSIFLVFKIPGDGQSPETQSKPRLYYDRRSVGQSILVPGTNLGTATNFSLYFFNFLDSYGFVVVRRPLWREVGSVVFSFCSASPAQPFSGLSFTRLMSIFYCLCFWESPNLEGQVPVFISARNKVSQLYSRALGSETR
jgi:hypothetical protein